MELLKINYTGFWPDFDKQDNFFSRILSKVYQLEVHDTPDILLCSWFDPAWSKFSCKKVFFTGENILPDPRVFDYSMGFAPDSERNLYLPLYRLTANYPLCFEKRSISRDEWQKRKMSSIVFSCVDSPERNRLFKKLQADLGVDSGGRAFNNVGGAVADKNKFIAQYKFNLAFENTRWPGYVTEKVVDAYTAGTIPLYWGAPDVNDYLNHAAFIAYPDRFRYAWFVEKCRAIATDYEAFAEIYNQPLFPGNVEPDFLKEATIRDFLVRAVEGPRHAVNATEVYAQFNDFRYARWMSKLRFFSYEHRRAVNTWESLLLPLFVLWLPFIQAIKVLRRIKRKLRA